jgi:hypothetical protein
MLHILSKILIPCSLVFLANPVITQIPGALSQPVVGIDTNRPGNTYLDIPVVVDPLDSQAEMASAKIDSLIRGKRLAVFTFDDRESNGKLTCSREYYVDTVSRYIVKSINDSTFRDYFGTRFSRVVIYLNNGSAFKTCWIMLNRNVPDRCMVFDIFKSQQPGVELISTVSENCGRLEQNWTRGSLDQKGKQCFFNVIQWTYQMQKKNGWREEGSRYRIQLTEKQ